jgi:hypothetical protein
MLFTYSKNLNRKKNMKIEFELSECPQEQRQRIICETSLQKYFGFSKASSQNAFFYLHKRFGNGNEFFDDQKQYGCYSFSPKGDKEMTLDLYIRATDVSFYPSVSQERLKLLISEHRKYGDTMLRQVQQYAKEKYGKSVIVYNGQLSAFEIIWNKNRTYNECLRKEFEQDAFSVFKRYAESNPQLKINEKNENDYFWSDEFREFYNQEFKVIAEELFGEYYWHNIRGTMDFKLQEKERKVFFKSFIEKFNEADYPNIYYFFKVIKDFKKYMKEWVSVRDVSFNLWGRYSDNKPLVFKRREGKRLIQISIYDNCNYTKDTYDIFKGGLVKDYQNIGINEIIQKIKQK